MQPDHPREPRNLQSNRFSLIARTVVLLAILGVSTVGPVAANVVCPPGDLTGDCRVDMDDLRRFVEDWLADSSICAEAGLAAHWRLDGAAGEPSWRTMVRHGFHGPLRNEP